MHALVPLWDIAHFNLYADSSRSSGPFEWKAFAGSGWKLALVGALYQVLTPQTSAF